MLCKDKLTRAVLFAVSAGVFALPLSFVQESMPAVSIVSRAEAAQTISKVVVLTGSLQDELGCSKDWDPTAAKSQMTDMGNGHYVLKGQLPAGNYEFKIAIGGSWQENYGAAGKANGANIELRLKAAHEVTFDYDEATHLVTYSYAGAEAEAAIDAKEKQQRKIVVAGNMQKLLGAGKDWDPSDMKTQMKDLGHGFYSYTIQLPAGQYSYKVAVNGSWSENYGLGGNADGANMQLTLDKPQALTIYYNDSTHQIKDTSTYTFLPEAKLPMIAGDLMDTAKGEAVLRDTMLDQFYTTTLDAKAGTYQAAIMQSGKKVMAQPVTLVRDGKIKIYFDAKSKKMSIDDGSIHEDKLYHNSWEAASRMPFEAIKTGDSISLSIRGQKGDIKKAQLILRKAKITANGGDEYNVDYAAGTTTVYDMDFAATEKDTDVWSKKIEIDDSGIYGYTFLLNGVKEYGDDAKPGRTGMVFIRNAKPFELTVYKADYKTPQWAKEAVVYAVFPDRFYNGDKNNDNAKQNARGSQPIQHKAWTDLPANYSRTPAADGDKYECNDFFGGDLAGITQKLDYIQSMGFNAIYLNPIMEAASNHRYDTVNYGRIDPFLGTQKDFDELIAQMNKRGMRLIMDGVFNHVGDDSIYFDRYGKYKTVGAYEYWSRVYDLMNTRHMKEAEAQKMARASLVAEGQVFSPYHWENWFEIKNQKGHDEMGDKYEYHDWQGYASLVPFKDYPASTSSPVKDEPNQLNNIDLDNYLIYGDDAIITSWFKKGLSGWRFDVAKEVPPEFWGAVRTKVKGTKTQNGDDPLLLGEIWQDGSQFLTGDQFDSVMNYKLSFALGDLFLVKGDAKAADDELKVLQQNYPKEALYDLMNIVDSHDVVRAIYKFGGGKDNIAQASLQDFDYDLGKARLKLSAIFLMGYPGMPTVYYGDEAGLYGSSDPDNRRTYPWGSEDQDLLGFYQRVIKVRNDHKALFAHGDVFTLKADGDVYIYGRSDSSEAGVVAINRGAACEQVIAVPQFADGTVFKDALDETYFTEVTGGALSLQLEAGKGRMLIKE